MSEPLGGLIVLVLIVVAFLVGSIPFGVVVGRTLFHTDIRHSGSGNIGAANALRTFGVPGAVAVLLLDSLKGFAPTLAAMWLAIPVAGAPEVAGFAALVGHCYSPWLGWRGGKGVATHLGVVFALSWESGLAFMAAFIVATAPTGYSSVGSLTATVIAAFALWYFAGPAALCYGVVAGALIFWRHRENIARLRAGTELPTTLLRRTRVP